MSAFNADPPGPDARARRAGRNVRLPLALAGALAGCGTGVAPDAALDARADSTAPPRDAADVRDATLDAEPVDALARDAASDATLDGAARDAAPDAATRDAAILDASPPPPLAPRLVRFERLATDPEVANVPAGAPGNSWGGQQSRVARLSSGEVYATYLTAPASGTNPSDARWVLMRRGARDTDAWTEVARRTCGREPMHLLRNADDRLFVLSWPGAPSITTVTTAGVTPSVGSAVALPAGFERLMGSATPYSGAGILADGTVCLVAARGDARTMPGAIYSADSAWDFACGVPGGAWATPTTLPIGLRYAYPFVLPGDVAGGWRILGTRDVQWAAAGYTRPPGAFDYVFNVVDQWLFPSTSATMPRERTELGRLDPTMGTTSVAYNLADAMIDDRGRLHVLTTSRSSTNVRQMEHLLVTAGGITRVTFRVGSYPEGSVRLVQDDHGRFVIIFTQSRSVYAVPATDADGLVLGPLVDFTSTFVTADRNITGRPYVATPRGGTANGRYVDLVIDTTTAGRAEVYAARIALY